MSLVSLKINSDVDKLDFIKQKFGQLTSESIDNDQASEIINQLENNVVEYQILNEDEEIDDSDFTKMCAAANQLMPLIEGERDQQVTDRPIRLISEESKASEQAFYGIER